MSHLVASQIVITDLEILKKAVAGFPGLTWNEGAKTFQWYVNDKTSKKELESKHGQCEHSISIAGAKYEVGVVRRKDGEGWSLLFDPFDANAAVIVGFNGCEKITAAYADAYTRDFASRNGFLLEESVDGEGNTVMVMTPPSE